MQAGWFVLVVQSLLTWLALACVGLAASMVCSCSLIVPVALATLLVVLGPFLPSLRVRRRFVDDPRPTSIVRFLLTGFELDTADTARLTMRIGVSAAMVPGLGVAAALALLVPLSPFLHGMFAGGALLVVLLAWIPLALAVRAFAHAESGWSAATAWKRNTRVLAACFAPFVIFAVATCMLRPDPDWYWSSLTRVYASKQPDTSALPHYPYPKTACSDVRMRPSYFSLCWYPVDATHCVPINSFRDICVACISNDHASEGCPEIDVRRDERSGEMQVGRSEVTRGLLYGASSANALDINHIPTEHFRSVEGVPLTARAVRHSVSVPFAWVILAATGLALAAFLLDRERRRLAALRRAQYGDGPYREPAAREPPEDAVDPPTAETLVWRYAAFALVASSTPVIVALVLGVGW